MRRITALCLIAVLAVSACGSNNSSSADLNPDDNNSVDAGTSTDSCDDVTTFMEAIASIPAETPEQTAENIDALFASLDAIEQANPSALTVDYADTEKVLNDLVELLEDYDYDTAAIENDPAGAQRLEQISTSPTIATSFMSIAGYYESSCKDAETGQ
jgi:hypothetical protein